MFTLLTYPTIAKDDVYIRHNIPFQICNIEADSLPFESEFFDAVSCCQALEHFTHSHLPPVIDMKRVLKEGGLIELDVPNAASFRNRSRSCVVNILPMITRNIM